MNYKRFAKIFLVIIVGVLFIGSVIKGLDVFHVKNSYRLLAMMLAQNGYIILVIWLFNRKRQYYFKQIGLRAPIKEIAYLKSIAIGALLFICGNLYMALYMKVFSKAIPEQDLTAFFPKDAALIELLTLYVTVAILAPVTEELLFRGVLYHYLMQFSKNKYLCMLATSVVFALAHTDIERFLIFVIGGMVFNYLSDKYQSLYVSMIAHSTWNTLSLVAFYAVISG